MTIGNYLIYQDDKPTYRLKNVTEERAATLFGESFAQFNRAGYRVYHYANEALVVAPDLTCSTYKLLPETKEGVSGDSSKR